MRWWSIPEGRTISGDRFLKTCRPAAAPAECPKRIAKIGLGHCPMERHALTGKSMEGDATGSDCLLKT
jgi:hypothetical protein